MTEKITFIGYGEAGGILAADLAKNHPVIVWDCKLDGAERETMLDKARRAGVRAAASLAEAIENATLIFSTVTADSALDVAQQSGARLREGQFFLDLNSVAPETKRQAAAFFLPGIFVEVAVMAPVPPARLRTPLLIGGPQAQHLTSRLQGLGLKAQFGDATLGKVSAVKMCRSVIIKGLEALTTECLFAARQYGVEKDVLAALHASFPSLGWNGAFPGYLISRVAQHGIRRSQEMEEVVKTLREVGTGAVMSQATATSQRQLPQKMATKGLVYCHQEPFDWQTLADELQ
ncbi:Putative dehydrogenase (plasmid) [Sodalis praecaptivus]|uniref:Putative dehydrogenase n=1 Tax=Sodalis praecaptivus TaxID=1239307 RepID=W0I491_9GAMM|nr:NAD(P)-dependent oxidoreductase [Sodalis praecaptivus]AHF79233.1 Putative dehydrogenase [Sodalis praecaptivus]